ncbi:TetR/AcrR family transcriptional regulator [Paraburkholderia phytofirmans]|uniref:Transcriptional regulator, TetR family n=1 Tax=Paraburkholderia phytofirmans (strain DSM 17436 / LMG 22146 / PsJN) TaxID=398527 RepID=B2T8B1_PARPJ|nr:TetR/AcrR family transcriptional regulator [Paraburkholderia phytofirmans]ACD20475.1 transcriptional regulator, TetR family [Paraburkholderia phytofirmans PsJN]
MGYSQAQKAESRQRVLETAARQIREDGIEALGVADCMRRAGLTHGAFYGHFESRDALIVEALEYAVALSEKRIATTVAAANASGSAKKEPLRVIAEMFLSEKHIKDPGNGCALCSLAGEARHAAPAVRESLTQYVHKLASRIAQTLAGDSETLALGIVATIVGAVTLARAVDEPETARSILAGSLDLIVAQSADA